MKKLILTCMILGFASGAACASQRYISLAPSTTEILYALGLGQEIVGVSSYCNFPADTKNKPVMGDFSHPNIEKIFSLRPDYIFCTGLEQELTITELKRLKLNVYVADPSRMEELYRTILDIGTITGKINESQALVDSMKQDIEKVQNKVRTIPDDKRTKVFIEIWREPMMTAGKGSFIDELITLAGGINVAHDVIRPYCNFSPEQVVSLDPDCIIMTFMDKEPPLKLVENRLGWSAIKAVRSGRVYNDISQDLLLRPGPRVAEGIRALYRKFYEPQ